MTAGFIIFENILRLYNKDLFMDVKGNRLNYMKCLSCMVYEGNFRDLDSNMDCFRFVIIRLQKSFFQWLEKI